MEDYWIKIKSLNFYSIKVRANTEWKFMEYITDDGISGISEITDTQLNSSVSKMIAQFSNRFRDEKLLNEENLMEYLKKENDIANSDILSATAISGIRSAFLDIFSKRMEISLVEYLSKSLRDSQKSNDKVELYANINRSLLPNDNGPVDRSPESFSKRAIEMEKKGFNTIKCAPFDECMSPFSNKGLPNEAINGLERISAISDSISKKTKLFVDCHSRFDLNSSYHVHDQLKERNVNWFEEPIDPEKFIEETTLDGIINDANLMHCPSGPISLLTSAHITSAIESNIPLEHAVEEVNWRKDLIFPAENIENGNINIPKGNGIGANLNLEMIIKKGKIWEE